MTTAQINANLMNAQKSTGPVTAQGKAASSRNATTHGLTSNKVKAAEAVTFEQFLNDYTALFQPQTDLERGLVRRCAEYQVRIDRSLEAESSLTNEYVNLMMGLYELSYEDALGRVFMDKEYCMQLRLVMRYQSQATRGYRQTRQELEQLIADRREAEQELAGDAPATSDSSAVSKNGFVSSNAPKVAVASAAIPAPADATFNSRFSVKASTEPRG